MDAGGNGELVLQNRDEDVSDFASMGNFSSPLSDKVLGVTVGSEPLYRHWDGMSSSSCAWAPLCSVEQHGEIGASSIFNHHQIDNPSYAGILQNQGTRTASPHLVQFQADHRVSGLQPYLPCFGSGRFSEMDSFFIQQRCQRFANFGFSASHSQHGSGSKTSKVWNSQSAADNFAQTRECRGFEEGSMKPSTDGKKRKRDNCSPVAQSKNLKTDQNDQQIKKLDKEKQNPEGKPATNISHQLVSKDVEDSSTDGDTPKEDYVHVRAKRGQATNRHSLAERVRREKIRERMKFLQDLVPGSSKIMGKAVMLDEIINYVLSLQRQVKFLSMKLATVYPEMTVDHEHILPSDGTIHHSQGGCSAIPGDTGMSSYPKEMLQRALLATHASILELSTMPSMASMWNNEDDRTSQMDFNPHLAPQNPDSSGCVEVEL